MDLNKFFKSCKNQAIDLCLKSHETTVVNIGNSKYGGRPDMPEDFLWPMDDEQRPLSLLFQINCEELTDFHLEELLPTSGRLCFFYELGKQDWEGLKNSVRVVYDDTPTELLHRVNFPESLSEEFRLDEFALYYRVRDSYPSLEDVNPNHPDYNLLQMQDDKYFELRQNLQSVPNDRSVSLASILGYADLIENNVVNDVKDYVLLLQMPSIEVEYMKELLFGDCGTIYFYISREDLKNRNFSNIKFEMQCY
ncbi:protein containing DUF1963 [gut metagenome]|uniref:Protein containing DUF1963 n=1 Tax=gut metagenome TaxID=749906 RepID=J9GQ32_9ZZZZ